MGIEGLTHMKSTEVNGYGLNSKDSCEKFMYPMFINKERMTTTQGAQENFVKTLFFILFFIGEECCRGDPIVQ